MKKILFLLFFLLLSLLGYSQCANVSISAPVATICSGTPIKLTAVVTGGTPGYTYIWSTGETTSEITVDKPGTYTLTVTDGANCPSTSTRTITEGQIPPAPTLASTTAITCPGQTTTLTLTGPGGGYQWYDENGNPKPGGVNFTTDPITVRTVYYVETTIGGCTSARTQVTVYPIAGPNATPASTCRGGAVTLTATGAGSYEWYTNPGGTGPALGTGSSFQIASLNNTTTYYVVGSTMGCRILPGTRVDATVIDAPPAPTVSFTQVCAGNTTNLHAETPTMPGATFRWYEDAAATQFIIASPDFTTGILNTSRTYYVRAISPEGCEGPIQPLNVTVDPIPPPPTFSTLTPICAGNAATITIDAPGGTYTWYNSPTSVFPLPGGGATYTTPVLTQTTTYYVEQISAAGCPGGRFPVTVTVNPAPAAPIFNPPYTICQGDNITITPLGPGGTYRWYATATDVTPMFTGTGANIITGLTSTTDFFVDVLSADNCVSATRTRVTVTVNTTPGQPSISGSNSVCSGFGTALTATGTGSSFEWFDVATGGVPIATGANFTSPALTADKTYWVQTSNGNCHSPRESITITVTPLPPAPTTAGSMSACAGTTPTLVATAGAGTVEWFRQASGGARIGTGSSFTLPSPITSTTTFYVQLTNNGCTSSPRTPLVVNVISTTNQFQYSSGTYCQTASNPTPAINVPGGTFSAPAGMVIDPTTGQINLAASTLGSYTVTYTNACAISTNQIAIVVAPDPVFTYSATNYCQSGPNVGPIFTNPLTGTPGVFSATPAGLRFTNVNSGIIDVDRSAPGIYTVINTIDAAGGCPTVASPPITVTIDPRVVTNAGPDQSVAVNTPVQLAGSITGGVTTGTWSGGAGSFSNINNSTAIYTPATGETSAILTLTSANPGTTCTATSDAVTISFTTQPPQPTVNAVAPICDGDGVILSVNPPLNGTYNWYTVATLGTPVYTGATFTTGPLSGSITYYVENVVNGIASNRAPVAVTVNPIPQPPTVAVVSPICAGTSPTMQVTNPTLTYRWYLVPTGGIAQFTGNIYTPPAPLTANQSYYVESVANNCPSATRTRVDVIVNPVPKVISVSADNRCSGAPVNYTILADLAGTTFVWRRDFVAGINEAAVSGQTTSTIPEVLTNNTNTVQIARYIITPMLNGCPGADFPYNVSVYPTARVTSLPTATSCSGLPVNYAIQLNTGQFTWGHETVGQNLKVENQTLPVISEALVNNTNAPINVVYTINTKTPTCPGETFTLTVTVNPRVTYTSAALDTACGGIPQDYQIQSNVAGASYKWTRAAVPGIREGTVTDVVSNVINETLNNDTPDPVLVIYEITAIAVGCNPQPFKYKVLIYPQPPTPIANAPSDVCVGGTITLATPAFGSYQWRNPNGDVIATTRTHEIKNAQLTDSGIYTLYVFLNGCSSVQAFTQMVTVEPLAIVNAGADRTVCPDGSGVVLNGQVSGGTTTGIWTSTNPNGKFLPSSDQLNATYMPDAADVAAGFVILTLTSTSKALCPVPDQVRITFGLVPATNAGTDVSVCAQDNAVPLNGQILIPGNGAWRTLGTGAFQPGPAQVNGSASPIYLPSAADKTAGYVRLVLEVTLPPGDLCHYPSDTVEIKFIPPPTLNAGGVRYVLENKTITLTPTVSDENVTYNWTLADGSPATGLSAANIKNPVATGTVTTTYLLTVEDVRGCISTSTVEVRVAAEVIAPNTFTPNNDGVNDLWDIKGLIAYENAVIDIFNRYGQKVYTSIGYSKPWDGTQNGKPLPVGTYYYVIDTKVFGMKYTGYIAIIR